MVDAALRAFLPVVGAVLLAAGVLIGVLTLALRARKPDLVREVQVRYLSWLAIAALALGGLAAGRAAWIALVGLLSLAAFREYARAVGLWMDRGFQGVVYVFIVLIFLTAWWPYATEPGAEPGMGWYGLFVVMPVWAILFVLLVPIVRGRYEHMLQRLALSIVGVLYFGWMLAHLAFLVNLPEGVGLVLFLTFLVAVNDVSAFVLGKSFGRRKLRPLLSPGKTWEGAVGALLVAVACGWMLRWLVPAHPPVHVLVVSALVGAAATAGDLALATLKRDLGIKDWGHLVPGHGGILDRVNSLLFATPVFFHYTRYFIA